MENITINLPQVYVNNIDVLVESGLFHSRSEGLRTAIREFLEKEILIGAALEERSVAGRN